MLERVERETRDERVQRAKECAVAPGEAIDPRPNPSAEGEVECTHGKNETPPDALALERAQVSHEVIAKNSTSGGISETGLVRVGSCVRDAHVPHMRYRMN